MKQERSRFMKSLVIELFKMNFKIDNFEGWYCGTWVKLLPVMPTASRVEVLVRVLTALFPTPALGRWQMMA